MRLEHRSIPPSVIPSVIPSAIPSAIPSRTPTNVRSLTMPLTPRVDVLAAPPSPDSARTDSSTDSFGSSHYYLSIPIANNTTDDSSTNNGSTSNSNSTSNSGNSANSSKCVDRAVQRPPSKTSTNRSGPTRKVVATGSGVAITVQPLSPQRGRSGECVVGWKSPTAPSPNRPTAQPPHRRTAPPPHHATPLLHHPINPDTNVRRVCFRARLEWQLRL